ncbi:MAG: valine--tRNA ligase [Planctomycetota bacterium]
MTSELSTTYDPTGTEEAIYNTWLEEKAFHADPTAEGESYCIVIPPPNVTAALHLGHALNNTLQDVLIRWRRMQRRNTLWMPGTDHAGIATQTVVEKRLLAEEGKRRTDFQRDEFIARVQSWKDEYEQRITNQLKTIGCSCDWDRQRFTMDELCARAVREVFFKLFTDGLIYRGKRLVNWDPATQTVLADDEVEHETVRGFFWNLKYPLTHPVEIPRSTGFQPVFAEGQILSKRNGAYLPHWTKPGGIYAVTFRLADSVPAGRLEGYRIERESILERASSQNRELTKNEKEDLVKLYSEKIESYLDAGHGECYLARDAVAEMVTASLKHFEGERYDLLAWCIMPNHVHLVIRPRDGFDLQEIMHSLKSYSANRANEILGREGTFWQAEYYDHLIRDEKDLAHCITYAVGNPESCGLENWFWRGVRELDEHGLEAHATDKHGQDARAAKKHGQDAHATETLTHVTVATTRPETMLGDTAIAMNPNDPRAKYLVGKTVRLPIVGREIPIIADDHVVLPDPDSDDEKARHSTGFLKVTPAHDPNDYQIGERNLDAIAAAVAPHDADDPRPFVFVNVMAPDGTISDRHGWEDARGSDAEEFLGMDRFEAREAIVEWFRQEQLLGEVRDYTHEVGHSYRSHVPIEPYLSDQWYVAVTRPIERLTGTFGHGTVGETDVPANSLAGLALKPLVDGRLNFTPDRYGHTYRTWLENLRDWPISRQLWWGHRIPVWSMDLELPAEVKRTETDGAPDAAACAALDAAAGESFDEALAGLGRYQLRVEEHPDRPGWVRAYVCTGPDSEKLEARIEQMGFQQDPDVLDTWFSSALWPFSTLGWPKDTPALRKYYPGNVLCTAREIITLWVSRMVMMGQYCLGDIPFSDVFIHAMIQDGQGRKMSKSLGNGIDPLDICDSHGADAMRFTMASMTTQTQDVRMPVEEITLPDGRTVNSSPKFDIGRNFCNKLWNASRFALMNIQDLPAWSEVRPHEDLADRWILSRLNATIRDITAALEGFRYNELADRLYHFVWDDFCDWYLEACKHRIAADQAAPKAVLAHVLDRILRLLHPVTPFITERIWQALGDAAPRRGPEDRAAAPLLVRADWPVADSASIHEDIDQQFALLQEIIREIRNIRTQNNVAPSRKIDVILETADVEQAQLLRDNTELMRNLAALENVTVTYDAGELPSGSAAGTLGAIKLIVLDVVDREAELQRLTKQKETLTRGIRGIEGKLGNENFVNKAPADVVQRERERLEQLLQELTGVEDALSALGG